MDRIDGGTNTSPSLSKTISPHVTRILYKVEETLAAELDKLTITYLNTAVTQLERKGEQIFVRIQDTTALEEAIRDSEELQDLILEKVNELNRRVELFQLHPCNWHQESDGDITSDSDHETASDLASTIMSSSDIPVTTAISVM